MKKNTKLNILLSKCDATAPIPDDLAAWFDSPPVGNEIITYFEETPLNSDDEYRAALKKIEGLFDAIPNTAEGSELEKLADPRLVVEFSNSLGHPNFTVCSLALLIESLSKIEPKRFTNLAGAIQINIQETLTPVEDVVEPTEDVVEPTEDVVEPTEDVVQPTEEVVELTEDVVEPTEEAPLTFEYAQEALQDSLYQVDAPSEINEIIGDLKSYNWYTQNPAIAKIGSLDGESLDASSCFVLGRNIYQAACGNSQKASEYMASLRRKLTIFPNDIANHILSGMVFEIYFDSKSEYRERVKFDYASSVLSLLMKDEFEQAKSFIRQHLQDYVGQLLYMPGDESELKSEITIKVSMDQGDESSFVLDSVVFKGKELIVDHDDSFWVKQNYNASSIKTEISFRLAIPEWTLTLKTNEKVGDKYLQITEGKMFDAQQAVTN